MLCEVFALVLSAFKFDSISALSNSIFDIIDLGQTSEEYHQRLPRTDKNYTYCINFIKMLFNILQIKPIFGDFVIQYRFLMLSDAGLSIFRNPFWVHIQCRFDILKYCAALILLHNLQIKFDPFACIGVAPLHWSRRSGCEEQLQCRQNGSNMFFATHVIIFNYLYCCPINSRLKVKYFTMIQHRFLKRKLTVR